MKHLAVWLLANTLRSSQTKRSRKLAGCAGIGGELTDGQLGHTSLREVSPPLETTKTCADSKGQGVR